MTNKELLKMCYRQFNPKTTMNQIISGSYDENKIDDFLSWNVDKNITVLSNERNENVGMLLELNHYNYSDVILISLGWEDLYEVNFINWSSGEVVKTESGIYCDMLFSIINSKLKGIFKMEFVMN